MTSAPSLNKSLLRGLALKCPKCGVGKLFRGYLKRQDSCENCQESFKGLDADDGPAWLTIGVVAIIVVPLLIALERSELFSYWQEMLIISLTSVAAALLILPLSKGVFIVALWLISRKPTR